MASKELSILLTAKDMASKTIGNVSKQVGLLGRMGGTVGAGMSALGNNLKRMGTALLAGAGITGIFSIVGALEQGISKADEMALAVEKLSGVTGLNAHAASQLVAIMGKYGVDTDKATTLAAFAEKTLGKLAGTTGKLTALDKKYGLSLVDSKGKVVDFQTELTQLADLYTNKAIPASERAAVAAQLLGRGYVALIPLLKLGAKGMAEAAAQADAMGLTLKTAEDVKNVTGFIAAQRDAKEAIGGLEMQFGLLVMPDLTKGIKEFTSFVTTHQGEIKKFFADGIHAAEQIGTVITGTVIPAIKGIADVVGGIWGAIPAPLQQLLAGGFIANKLTGGMIVNLAGDLFKRGGTPANPLFVADVTGGLGKGVGGLPAAAKGALGGGLLAAGATVAAGAAVGGVAIDQYLQAGSQADAIAAQTAEFVKTATLDQLESARQAVLTGMQQIVDQPWNPIAPAAAGGLQDTLLTLNKAIDAMTPVATGEHSALAASVVSYANAFAGGFTKGEHSQRGAAVLANNAATAGISERAIANGLRPTVTGIAATLARDSARREAAQRIAASMAAASARMLAVAQAVGAASIVAAIHGISAPKVIVNTTVSARETKVVTQKFERYQGKLVPVF